MAIIKKFRIKSFKNNKEVVKLENISFSFGERKVLENRSDDESNTILKRYDIYMDKTRPVLDYYSSKKEFHEIDGNLQINQISEKMLGILNV